MAIVFTCACGRLLKAKPEFAGKRTKCPHCGGIMAIPAASGLSEWANESGSDPNPAKVPQAVGLIAGDDGIAISLDDSPPATTSPRIDLSGSTDSFTAVVPHQEMVLEPAEGSGPRHYRVLTHRDMGFAAKFDAAKLEETLNRHAREGWAVKSAVTLNLTTHSGNHEEMIVILER
jgi:hypothetical protein